MLTDKLEQPVAFSIHFPHSPLGRLQMKEPIVPLQRSRQVGREQQQLQEPSTAGYSPSSGRKRCRGGCPGAETPRSRLLKQRRRSPAAAPERTFRSSRTSRLCETTAAAVAELPTRPSPPQQDAVPPRGTAACSTRGVRWGQDRGLVAGSASGSSSPQLLA